MRLAGVTPPLQQAPAPTRFPASPLFARRFPESPAGSARSQSDTQWNPTAAFPPPVDLALPFLRECTRNKNPANTKRLHHFIVSYGFQSYSFWADHLLQLLTLFGNLRESVQVFHRVLHPSLQSYHALLAAHIKHGECERALHLYGAMVQASITPDRVTFLHVLQACSFGGPACTGMMFHDQLIRNNFNEDASVVNTLIDMYSKCACIDEARCVFDKLARRTVVSWGAMIGGYAKNRKCDQAFDLLKQMQEKKVKLNSITISCILKACDNPGALEQGRSVHILAVLGGHEVEVIVERALINMYITCNSLDDARTVFDQMEQVDLKCWGRLTAGYSQNGLGVAAFQIFAKMQQQGLSPDRVILLSMLEACQSIGSLVEGNLVHLQIIIGEFERHTSIGNALIDMHAMCGSLEDAHNVFDRLEIKDVISWAAIISGYVQHNLNSVALNLFCCMQQSGLEPDEVIYLWTLKACGKLKCIFQGILLHNIILLKGFDLEVTVVGSLLDMYCGCGRLEEALFIFERVPKSSISVWGTVISGFVQHGEDLLALDFFKRMQREGFEPDVVLSLALLKACSRTGAIDEGRFLHNYMKSHQAEMTNTAAIAIMDMYSKCGFLVEAHELFESLPEKDFSCWSAIIVANIENNGIYSAFALFERMQQLGLHADKTLLLHLCKACGQAGAMEWGNIVCYLLLEAGFDKCLVVASSLIDMYAKCEYLKEAERVLISLSNPDVVCWGALLTGFISCGSSFIVLDYFSNILDTGLKPDPVLFILALKACGNVECLEGGRGLHFYIVHNKLEQDKMIIGALLEMYGKCGSFDEGQSLLDVKHWRLSELQLGPLISGYVEHGYDIAPLKLFEVMQERGTKIGKATFLCILKACSNIGAIEYGRFIHNKLVGDNLDTDLAVANSLIDMYSKCGSPSEAYRIFERLADKDVVSWSVMICAYAAQGNWKTVFELIKSMQTNDIQPDDPLFVSLLSVCSQNGLLNEGCQQLGKMEGDHLLSPRIDHYNCMLDVFGRGGKLNEAKDMLKTIPLSPNLVSWLSLLTGCRLYGGRGSCRQLDDENMKPNSDSKAG